MPSEPLDAMLKLDASLGVPKTGCNWQQQAYARIDEVKEQKVDQDLATPQAARIKR
jgi:hypothetical protein